MTGLNGHISCLPEAAQCIVGVYGRWGGGIQRGKQRLLYVQIHNSLYFFWSLEHSHCISSCDASNYNAFYDASSEIGKNNWRPAEYPWPSEERGALVCFLVQSINVLELFLIFTARKLTLSIISTLAPSIHFREFTPPPFLKSMTSSFILLTLREWLLYWHQVTKLSLSLSPCCALSGHFLGSGTLVVSFAKLSLRSIRLHSRECIQRGWEHSLGTGVLQIIVEDVLLSVLVNCSLSVKNSRIQLPKWVLSLRSKRLVGIMVFKADQV